MAHNNSCLSESARQQKREQLMGLLGDLPPRDKPVAAQVVDIQESRGYRIEKLLLDLNGIEPVPAYFVKPLGAAGPLPCMIYHHAHCGDYVTGKDEFLQGRDILQSPPYAEELVSQGYCGLCIDAWCFGERRHLSESDCFKLMLWRGQVLWGMMVHDGLRCVDYLDGRPDVDSGRIGTIGLSMGSTMSWWLAALDTRIKVCVDICCLTDYDALIETRGLSRHGLYYFVPALLKHFSAADINALIAPRAHLSLAGNLDGLTPPLGLNRIDTELKQVYASLGAVDAWKLDRSDTGHYETSAMRATILAFLEKWL